MAVQLRHEHQEPDANDNVKVLIDSVGSQIRQVRQDRQAGGGGDISDSFDRGVARIDRQYRAASAGRLDREISQAAAQVEDSTAEVGERQLFKRIEREVSLSHLSPELSVEKPDAVIHPIHSAVISAREASVGIASAAYPPITIFMTTVKSLLSGVGIA